MTTATPGPMEVALFDDQPPYVGIAGSDAEIVGGGEDLQRVIRAALESMEDYDVPASRQVETLVERFSRLVDDWKEDTAFTSSVTAMSTHPAYQQIIGMGKPAVPFLLAELERELGHWFWALHAITGVDPVPPQDAGDVTKMAAAWVKWGRQQGHLS